MRRTGTRERVAELLEEGTTVAEIAERLGLSKPTVCYHKRKLGYSMNSRFSCRYDWAAVQRYYDSGHSMRECQNRFGFCAASWHKAVQRKAILPRPLFMPLEELLQIDTPRSRHHIKRRLIAAGLKQNRCENCGISTWYDKPLSLALHHVNGRKHDNRLENLTLLCPNCHSQTHNFGTRNRDWEREKAA
jgi:5-methylcytosine-specific restriction endonuclease McrA